MMTPVEKKQRTSQSINTKGQSFFFFFQYISKELCLLSNNLAKTEILLVCFGGVNRDGFNLSGGQFVRNPWKHIWCLFYVNNKASAKS